ncbi:bifunctional pyr operon transcriptional regulator/uracil phosphoribosyltransferase PyrR [Chlamydiota bacterium]
MQPKNLMMDKESIARTITRMSHEILEKNSSRDNLILIGVLTRGAILAKRIKTIIDNELSCSIPLGILDITLHRDDLLNKACQELKTSEIPVDITNKHIILIDDVLFSGRTVRAALDELIDFGRPQKIQLAVLIDRGHRELPIRADYVGKNIPTNTHQIIKVHLSETDGVDEVVLLDKQ